MLQSQVRDSRVEFVADQLKRVQWISGYRFIEAEGYALDWSAQGSHRMLLLQMALKSSKAPVHGLHRLKADDPGTDAAIKDFWDACVAQLSLSGQAEALPALVKIIESWRPRA